MGLTKLWTDEGGSGLRARISPTDPTKVEIWGLRCDAVLVMDAEVWRMFIADIRAGRRSRRNDEAA